MDFFGIGPSELILILAIAFIVLGPAKLPEVGRTLGKVVKGIQKAAAEVSKELDNREDT